MKKFTRIILPRHGEKLNKSNKTGHPDGCPQFLLTDKFFAMRRQGAVSAFGTAGGANFPAEEDNAVTEVTALLRG